MGSKFGIVASWANIVFSVSSFALGVVIIGNGGGAGLDAIVAGAPLLLLSEGIKLCIGVCIAVQVNALYGLLPGLFPRLVGFASAVLMAVAGLIGAGAILLPEAHAMGALVNPVALASVVAGGLWALSCAILALKIRLFPAWLTVVGMLLFLPSIAALFFPAAGLSVFMLGLFWNLGLVLIFKQKNLATNEQSTTLS